MALPISKHIEIKTSISIRLFVNLYKKVTDARILNKITYKEIKMRVIGTPKLQEITPKILRPH